jgi:UDP-GlcNAc:undecaprenyl-phosphate/decaprenyl-phosphate GlcNAc-1-phosphate transferase
MDFQFVPILVVGFALSLGLTPVSRQVALRLGVVDQPNQRKIHHDHKPLMGGLAIYISFAVSLALFSPARFLSEMIAILGGAGLLALVGLADDRFNLVIPVRLGMMALASCALLAAGIYIQLFDVLLLDYAVTILWVLALTNAVNFLDNMDGLAAGLSAIAAGYFLLLGLAQGLPLVSVLAAALLGSAVGFLAFNFNPASTFMGDMGALPLGFVLAALGIIVEFRASPVNISWMVPVLVLALPIFDINLVVFTRIMEGRSPGQAGKDHTSHRLLSLGLNQRMTLFVLYAGCMLFGLMGLVIGTSSDEMAWRIGIAGMALLGGLFVCMIWLRYKYQKTPLKLSWGRSRQP